MQMKPSDTGFRVHHDTVSVSFVRPFHLFVQLVLNRLTLICSVRVWIYVDRQCLNLIIVTGR